MSELEDGPVQKARELAIALKQLRIQELEIRAKRLQIREEWANLYKELKGVELRDATQAYWDAQTDQDG